MGSFNTSSRWRENPWWALEATIIVVLEVAAGLFPADLVARVGQAHGWRNLPPRLHSLSALAQFPQLFLGEAGADSRAEDRRVVVLAAAAATPPPAPAAQSARTTTTVFALRTIYLQLFLAG